MHKSTALLPVAGLIIGALAVCGADDQSEARAVIDRAIRSMGGEEKLTRCQAQTWTEKATFFGAGGGERYEATYSARWPDKLRVDIPRQFTLAINGPTGWERAGGKTRALSKDEWQE